MAARKKLKLEEIAELPFHRGGPQDNFDCAYAVRVWDARNRVALNKAIEADPYKRHSSPDGRLNYVPHGDGSGTIFRPADST